MANTFNTAVSNYKESLAKDLGYSSYKEYLKANKNEYFGSTKQRLEQGSGFKEAISGGIGEGAKSIKDAMNPKKIAKKAYMNFFSGDDVFSAYMRGRLVKKPKDDAKSAKNPQMEFTESYDKKLVGRDKKGKFTKLTDEEQWAQQRKYGLTKLTATSPSSMGNATNVGGAGDGGDFGGITGIAKDVLIIRNAISQLLSFEREGKEQGDRAEQLKFLEEQDAREAGLETSPTQISTQVNVESGDSQDNEKEGGGKSLMDFVPKLFGMLKKGLLNAFKLLFKSGNLLKVLGKVFVIATIIVSLFKGITAGFDRWKETGSIKEAIIAGLGAIVDFLSFGFFGEDTVRNIFDTVGEWIGKIKDTIVETFYKVKDWIVNNIGIPEFSLPLWAVAPPAALINKIAEGLGRKAPFPKEITIGPFYPFKDNKTSSTPEYSKRPDKSNDTKTDKKEDTKSTQPKPLEQKQQPNVDNSKLKANDLVGKDVSNMSDEEIEKLIKASGGNPEDFEIDIKGRLQQFGSFNESFSNSSPSPLQGMVQQFGGDEASAGLQKDQEKLSKFNAEGGVSSKFDEMKGGASNTGSSLGNAQGAISSKIQEGGVTPEPVSPFGSATSGATLSQGSVDVETGQREEMTQDSGNIINSPKINNNTQSTSKSRPPADVMNFEFADTLRWT